MQDELRRVLGDVFGMEAADVTDDLTPETVETWDSLNHLRLVTAVEEAFGIKFSMAEIESMMSTVGRVRETVERHTVVTGSS